MKTKAKVITLYIMVSLVITNIPLFSAVKVLAAEKKVISDRNVTGKYNSLATDEDKEIIKPAGGEYEAIDKTEAYMKNVSRILSAMDIKNVEKTAEILKEQEGVKSVGLERQYLDIIYETGVCQSVLVSAEEDVLKQLRGANTEEKDSTMYINGSLSDMRKEYADYRADDKCSTLFNRNILLWIPMDSRWGEHDEIAVMKQIVRAEDNLDLELTILRDERATAEALKKMDKYGMVIFASHGANGEWLLTGEKYEPGKIPEETKKALLNQEQRIITLADENQAENYYGVTPGWFDKNINNLPKTIIYNNTCGSMKTDAMWKVFEKKGASAYMGYSGSVRNEFAIFNLAMFFANFLDERESVFNSCPFFTDKYYNKEGAGVVPAGQGNFKIARDFEEPGMKPVMFPEVKDSKIRGAYIDNEQEDSKPSIIWTAAKGLKQAFGYINEEELHYISVGCAAILVGLNGDKNEGLLKSIQYMVEEKSPEAWYALESEIMVMEGKNFYETTRIDEDDYIDSSYYILEDTYEDYTILDLLYSVEEMYGSLPSLIIRLFFAAAGVAVMGANIRFK